MEQAKADGVELVGPGRLLTDLTTAVPETALEVEIGERLDYDKYAVQGRTLGNSRNGSRTNTVLAEAGPVTIEAPGTGTARSSRTRSRSTVRGRREVMTGGLAVREGPDHR